MARGYSDRVVLGCLLHDGSEAYLSDITRPVKKHLTTYLNVEKVLQGKVFEKWVPHLTDEEKILICEVDDAILYYEFIALFGEKIFEYTPILKSSPRFEFIDFSAVEDEFLELFSKLVEKVK
jgi:hypothetical protein